MKSLLTSTPKLWSIECKYCLSSNTPDKNQHELELLAKAQKLCQRPEQSRIKEFLTAEFLRLDHSVLAPQGQLQILLEVHSKTGCTCITDLVMSSQDSDPTDATPTPPEPPEKSYTFTVLPPATARHPSTTKTRTTNRVTPAKPTTLLERLKAPIAKS